MTALVLRITAVDRLADEVIAAGMFDADLCLRDQRTFPERVLREIPVGPDDVGEARAWLDRSARLPSVQAGRRRWAIVPAGGAR